MSETRKLAAILVADVVGYSRLAGADEERTLARLRSEPIDPAIAAHHGRVVNRTGDGVLVEFRSVVDAVRCAIEIQLGMPSATPACRPIRIRPRRRRSSNGRRPIGRRSIRRRLRAACEPEEAIRPSEPVQGEPEHRSIRRGQSERRAPDRKCPVSSLKANPW